MRINFSYAALVSFLVLCGFGFAACSETDTVEDTKYLDWSARNDEAFLNALNEAKSAIAGAKTAYGDNWEEHCDWRVFRTYAMSDSVAAKATDSVAVRILQRGSGSGCPLYTDSVRVNYLGRYIPNALSDDVEERTKGEVFAYSGVSKDSANVFSPAYAAPVTFLVSGLVEGFTTAVMRMHIGDMWRVYIPQQLGYGSTGSYVQPYSTLIYDIQLKSYYRKGTTPLPWQ